MLFSKRSFIKVCERCFLCHSVVLCPSCSKCKRCCIRTSCRGKTSKLLPGLAGSGCRSEGDTNFERGLYPSISEPAKVGKTSHSRKLLCQSSQEQLPVRGIASAYRQKCCRTSAQTDLSREQSKKYLRFHVQGRTYQFKALPFGLSTAPMEFTVLVKEVKLMAGRKGMRIHQYLDDWLVRAKSYHICLQHTQSLVKMCQALGWLVNTEKSELLPKQVFNFVGYQFDLRFGRVRPTPDRWQSLQDKIQTLLAMPACPVRQFMSLIGLLTATEKQVHLGRLHMRPIQWHLKNNWRIPESLEKIIDLPRSLHPHLQWWLEEGNVLQGQPLHPEKHALQIFTDASKEGWGAHLNEHTARGSWSVPESQLHINYLELKAVFLALKEFQELCIGKMVLVATDNTTVVAYINKEGGMRSGPLCALLWRILTWCSQRQVTRKA